MYVIEVVPALNHETLYRRLLEAEGSFVAAGTGGLKIVGALASLMLLVWKMGVLAEDCKANVWV